MNTSDYVWGVGALALTFLPWIPAARWCGRRLAPRWSAAARGLVSAVIGISGLVVVAQLLGVAGLFSRWPMAGASAVAATAVWGVARRGGRDEQLAAGAGDDADGPRLPIVALAATGVAVLAICAALLGRDARVLHTGPQDLDSLHYHLTNAALFEQSHTLDHLHQTASSDESVYYPYDAELLDAVTMFGPRPDLATLPLNVGFALVLLLGCWVIGSRWSVAPAATAAGAAFLAVPLVAGGSAGPGLNDIPSTAFFIAAVALLLTAGLPRPVAARGWPAQLAVAGLACGLAAGSKLSLLAPVGALALGALWLARGDRWRTALLLAVPAFVTGGLWYVRDWVIAGTPLPGVNLVVAGHGWHAIPNPEVAPYDFTVAHYLTDLHVIRHWFVPGLRVVWTPAWPLLLALMAAGVVGSLVWRDRGRRVLGGVVVIGLLAYLVTPTTALGAPGAPVLFATNTRYAIPNLVLAMVLVATLPPVRRWLTATTVGFAALTVALLSSSHLATFDDRLLGTAAAAALAATAAWWWATRHLLHRRAAAAVGVAAVLAVVAVAAGFVQRDYLKHRYATTAGIGAAYHWGSMQHGTRIAVVGHGLEYPLYGVALDNAVDYVGVSAPDGSFDPPTSCSGFRAALAATRARYLVIEPLAAAHTDRIERWTASVPGVRTVLRNPEATVYAVPRPVTTEGC